MIFRWYVLVLSIVLSPGYLYAQPAKSVDPSQPSAQYPSAGANADAKMYEDIEILRRILERKLHALYPRNVVPTWIDLDGRINLNGSSSWAAVDWGFPVSRNNATATYPYLILPNDPNTAFKYLLSPANNKPQRVQQIGPSFEMEGVYLKGQGIVYTVTVSSLQLAAKAETAPPVSDWESARREVRNEKETPKAAVANKPSALSDVLLKVLAENGHHLSQLGENESLTVVVTVRDKNLPLNAVRRVAVEALKAEGQLHGSASSSKVRDLELLGDLHMKQEHYGEAKDAFLNAMKLNSGGKQTAVLARKLAQAYLMLDKIEDARKALDRAIALTKETTDAKDKTAPKPAAVALPVKLIVSAPKKLLDEAAKGKISAEEFRRRASVETLRFDDRRR